MISLGNEEIKANITRESIKEPCGLTRVNSICRHATTSPGTERIANIKLATSLPVPLSATEGANVTSPLRWLTATLFPGSITNEAIESLGLKVGDPALRSSKQPTL